MKQKYFLEKLTTFLFYFSILFFLIAFNFQDNKSGGWVQQFIPNTNGVSINDIIFLDSLNGFITHPYHIIRTTNGGTNWFVQVTDSSAIFSKIQFSGNVGYIKSYNLYKTTNSGNNWFIIPLPDPVQYSHDMHVLNKDTLFLTQIALGGLFKSTNGGYNWIVLQNSSNAPGKIYMINNTIGFCQKGDSLYKTTNGGYNFFILPIDGYKDMHFLDTLRGWKTHPSGGNIKKTTDGGLNWTTYNLVPVGIFSQYNIYSSAIEKFTLLNKDTIIWGIGYSVLRFPNSQFRGFIQKTTNVGNNWGFQIPDTSYNINSFYTGLFIDIKHGWAQCFTNTGVHTSVGGNDTTYFVTTGINNQNQNILADDFILYQNYPNPFNSKSKIKYKIEKMSNVKLILFDITGKKVTTLVNEKQNSGEYNIKFDGSNLSSGIYFYTLFADGVRVDTKKTILIK